jgi:hypothetical protein
MQLLRQLSYKKLKKIKDGLMKVQKRLITGSIRQIFIKGCDMNKKWQRATQLLIDNPRMSYKTFKKLTGYSKITYYQLKSNIKASVDAAIKYEVKQRFLREMRQRMKEKYGYVNLKGTPLERRR